MVEAREGFKKTEVGEIPEDWRVVPFERIFTFHSTSNYSKAQMSEDGEVGCIHYGLIHAVPNQHYDLRRGIKYYVSKEQAKYELVKNGDVIMVDASEDIDGLNKSVEVFGIGDKKYISGLHTYLLRDKDSTLVDRFRGIVLNSKIVKDQMLHLAVGMKVFGVSKTQLVNVQIPLPPTLAEQQAIAGALSDVDELITSMDTLIEKKKAIKQGAMQQLLTGKTRLVKDGSTKFKKTEVGEVPEDWEIYRLGEIGEFKNGINKSKTDFGFGVPFVNLMDVFGIPSIESSIGLGLVNASRTESDLYSLKKGDVLFVRSSVKPSGVGLTTAILENIENTVFSGFLIRFRFNKKIDLKFKIHCFHSTYFRNNTIANSSVSANTNINQDALKALPLVLPPTLAEQQAIAKALSEMDQELQDLQSKKSKYQQIKQGMMQELLTGRTRLV